MLKLGHLHLLYDKYARSLESFDFPPFVCRFQIVFAHYFYFSNFCLISFNLIYLHLLYDKYAVSNYFVLTFFSLQLQLVSLKQLLNIILQLLFTIIISFVMNNILYQSNRNKFLNLVLLFNINQKIKRKKFQEKSTSSIILIFYYTFIIFFLFLPFANTHYTSYY